MKKIAVARPGVVILRLMNLKGVTNLPGNSNPPALCLASRLWRTPQAIESVIGQDATGGAYNLQPSPHTIRLMPSSRQEGS